MAEYITERLLQQGIVVKQTDIVKVLELEDDFLRLKGVIEDIPSPFNEYQHFNILCSIDGVELIDGEPCVSQMDSFAVRIESNDLTKAEDTVSEKLKEFDDELRNRFPDFFSLSSYPTTSKHNTIEFDNLSVDSIISVSTYLQSLN